MSVEDLLRTVVIPQFQQRVRRSILLNFREGGRPDPWKKSLRAEGTHKSKFDGQDRQGRTLVDRGILQNSINVTAEGMLITAGTSVVYAQIHDQGGEINKTVTVRAHKRKISQAFGREIEPRTVMVTQHNRQVRIVIPQRQFMMLQKEDLEFFRSLLQRKSEQLINKDN